EVDPLADAERRDLPHLAEVKDERSALHAAGEAFPLEGLVDGAGELEAGDRAVGQLVDVELGLDGRGRFHARHVSALPPPLTKKWSDFAWLRNSRRLRSRSKTPVTSVRRPGATSKKSPIVALAQTVSPRPAPPRAVSIWPRSPRSMPPKTCARSRRPKGSV